MTIAAQRRCTLALRAAQLARTSAHNLQHSRGDLAPTKSPTSTQSKKFVDASEHIHYLTHTTRVMFQLTDHISNFVTRNRGEKGGIINGDQESC
jgi:hypothetical protein